MNYKKCIEEIEKHEIQESEKSGLPVVTEEEFLEFHKNWDEKSPMPERFNLAGLKYAFNRTTQWRIVG